jgi:hypothetical protein
MSGDLIFIFSSCYILLVLTVAKYGNDKECGVIRAFAFSFLLTPVLGYLYVRNSHRKNVLNIVHYRCKSCGMEHTTHHEFCPICKKEGKHKRLIKICMQTY